VARGMSGTVGGGFFPAVPELGQAGEHTHVEGASTEMGVGFDVVISEGF